MAALLRESDAGPFCIVALCEFVRRASIYGASVSAAGEGWTLCLHGHDVGALAQAEEQHDKLT